MQSTARQYATGRTSRKRVDGPAVSGRRKSRRTTENENNDTLNTKGYHFEHKYVRGKHHVAAVLASLALVPLRAHAVREVCDCGSRVVREQLPSRRTYSERPRTVTLYSPFDSSEGRFNFVRDVPGAGAATACSPGRCAQAANLALLALSGAWHASTLSAQ